MRSIVILCKGNVIVAILPSQYHKLCWLKEHSDFFTLDAIRFRHPQLYHTYITEGHTPGTHPHTLTHVLEKSLLNHEYKELLKDKDTLSDPEEEQEEPDPEEQEFNETTLMVIVERLFMEGKEKEIDYRQIDQDEKWDNSETKERDQEEEYFRAHGQEEGEEEEACTDTGVQDY